MFNIFRFVLQLLQKGTKLVLEQVLTTIATVADTAESRFIKYYDRFMPSLKYIFTNAVDKDYRLLRGKAIECISLIGLAVGAEKVRICIRNMKSYCDFFFFFFFSFVPLFRFSLIFLWMQNNLVNMCILK